MARKKELCRASNGQYIRNIGWKRSANGYSQPKFYLGHDESKAKIASLRLEQLWTQVAKRWERERCNELVKSPLDRELRSSDSDALPENNHLRAPSYTYALTIGAGKSITEMLAQERPVWDAIGLEIAEAIRRANTIAKVSPPPQLAADPSGVLNWLAELQEDITVLKIELIDEALQDEFYERRRRAGRSHIELGRKLLHEKAGGESLYVALDAYKCWITSKFLTADKRVSTWGKAQTNQVEFIRRHVADCALGEMTAKRIEEQIDILRLRPLGEGSKQTSATWARNCIKQYRHFLRWLNRSDDFSWKRPTDLEMGQVRIPLTPLEKSATARSAQVQTYSLDELKTCWEYASPFQRLLMLLALNCGFGRAEIASLEMADLLLDQKHPHETDIGYHSTCTDAWILRARHKTGVYGEWKLWQETIAALKWWLKQREAITLAPGVTTLLANQRGQRYDSPTKGNNANYQLPNSWFQLAKKIQKDLPTFRSLSFGKLRKTAGNLIRKAADGEVAGIFLCHGTPVKSDELLDLYTNRDFVKVFKGIDAVGSKLRPLWSGVPMPFPEVRKKGGSNISEGKIRRIQKMKQQGFKTSVIMEAVKVSRSTVCRWASSNSKMESEELL